MTDYLWREGNFVMHRLAFKQGTTFIVMMALTAPLAIADSPAETTAANAAKDAVEVMNRTLNDFVRGKGPKNMKCDDFYSPDAILLHDKQKIVFGTKELAENCPTPDPSVTQDFFGSYRKLAAASGELVIDSGWVKHAGPNGVEEYRYMDVWLKQPDGSWKMIRDMMIPLTPPATNTATKQQ